MSALTGPEVSEVPIIAPTQGLLFVHHRFRVIDARPIGECGYQVRQITALRGERVFHRLAGATSSGDQYMTRATFTEHIRRAFRPCPVIAPPEAWVRLCRAIGNHGRALPSMESLSAPLDHPWLVAQGYVELVGGEWQVSVTGRRHALMVIREVVA